MFETFLLQKFLQLILRPLEQSTSLGDLDQDHGDVQLLPGDRFQDRHLSSLDVQANKVD